MDTDHEPLLAILAIPRPGVQEGSTHVSSCETSAMGCVLMGYQYDVKHHSTTTTQHCNADGFSRLPRKTAEDLDEGGGAAVAASFNMQQMEALEPISSQKLAGVTARDPVFSQVIHHCIETGGPERWLLHYVYSPSYHQNQEHN